MRQLGENKAVIKYFTIASIIFLYFLLLYSIPRSNFISTFSSFFSLFVLYFSVIKHSEIFSLKVCLVLAFCIRMIALFNVPSLSDDYFRFIWDGQMFDHQISPFAFTPDDYMKLHPDKFLQILHDNMNSAEYYSVYPPVLQYIFAVAVKLAPSNIYGAEIVMKFFILCAECLTALILYKYCSYKKMNVRNILWYLLNPLVVVELIGNIHFEAFLILGLVGTFYFLEKNRLWPAALWWAVAICSKFLPLMLAPLFLCYLGLRRCLLFGAAALLFSLLLFLPFMDHSLINIQYSISKFYDLFEFNAAFYYAIKWGFSFFSDYDFSDSIAKSLGYVSFILIMGISFFRFKKDKLLVRAMLIFFIYFLTTTMVHPWYVTTLIIFSVFKKFKFPVIFSMMIPLSYYPYSLKVFNENYLIIFFEYAVVMIYFLWEAKFWKRLLMENFEY